MYVLGVTLQPHLSGPGGRSVVGELDKRAEGGEDQAIPKAGGTQLQAGLKAGTCKAWQTEKAPSFLGAFSVDDAANGERWIRLSPIRSGYQNCRQKEKKQAEPDHVDARHRNGTGCERETNQTSNMQDGRE